jgi:uncharacterized protein (DUF58 family)
LPARTINKLLGSSALLFLPGMFLGNLVLISMALVPLSFALFGLVIVQPKDIEIRRITRKEEVLVGDEVENRIQVEVKDGMGMVVLADDLPEEFELVSGSNFKVIWKGPKAVRDQIVYRVRCVKRGTFKLRGVRWESRHPLRLRRTEFGRHGERTIVVKPKLLDVGKVRSFATASKIPYPSAAAARIGPVTMDFKELRPYAYGDPYKFINWKATARSVQRGRAAPIVNDYEREGMKVVWIFLDSSATMTVGPSVTNVFEHALEAVHGLAYYYLKRGCRVGLCVYNGKMSLLYPDAGNRQYQRILREILALKPEETRKEESTTRAEAPPAPPRVSDQRGAGAGAQEPTEPPTTLRDAVSACRKYAPSCKPLFVVVTRFTKRDAGRLLQGVKAMARSTGIVGPRMPVMVVNVSGYQLAARSDDERAAGEILWMECILSSKKFRGRITWVDWDPTQMSFTNALLQQVVRR